jgi:hypothetical protein
VITGVGTPAAAPAVEQPAVTFGAGTLTRGGSLSINGTQPAGGQAIRHFSCVVAGAVVDDDDLDRPVVLIQHARHRFAQQGMVVNNKDGHRLESVKLVRPEYFKIVDDSISNRMLLN